MRGEKFFVSAGKRIKLRAVTRGADTLYQQASPLDSHSIQTAACQGLLTPLKPLLNSYKKEKGTVNTMLKALIGYMIGSMSGVALMCMLQINRVNKWKEMNDYENRGHEEEK